ncbi:NAD-dependent epimerase/dehydratase family protein [Metabacillus sp. GX 13764]|uniref:NAD-dependent epimerase/dehydratase family protein n=1 Tax=Metabacillus kandeliae TaxID=2900151 RepID=UPI001E320F6F|nr:NAD-dependent epimerase/dehydratase family protein [Metabacillus kandeliae]MCD7032974.1 NAD-dependent epimerase/dehydratase family protein [Metabacillus kandeliae]
MKTVEELEERLSEPSEALIEDICRLDGDLLILGAGGKMGPSLAKLAARAVRKSGIQKKVTAVSRFTNTAAREELEQAGVETIAADLLEEDQLKRLPDCQNVIYMAGHKFGTSGNESFTWMMNAYTAGRAAEKYKNSRIAVFSTGNVYPLTPAAGGGAREETKPGPVGEYAQSCLGRERIMEHFSKSNGTPIVFFRLNYANDLRYGVLLEIAKAVKNEKPLDLSMGYVNVIWQGDANEMAIRSLLHASSPPAVLNVTGPETLSVRAAAEYFAEKFNKKPVFEGTEQDTALLSNAGKAFQLFGYPSVTLLKMMDWTADWLLADGIQVNKPTHFQEREGAF